MLGDAAGEVGTAGPAHPDPPRGRTSPGCAPRRISSHEQAKMSKMPKEVFIIHKFTVLKIRLLSETWDFSGVRK